MPSYTLINRFGPVTVKDLLENHLLIPRKVRHFLRTRKGVTVNGQAITWQSLVTPGDEVCLSFDATDYPDKALPFGDKNLVTVLYEDDHLIVVDKPAGLKTHGNEPQEIALLNHVSAHVGTACHVVHRLDKETSGAVLFAKNAFVLPLVNRLLENRQIKRCYLALVEGSINRELELTAKIGRHRHDRRKRVVDPRGGQTALTHVTPLRQLGQQTLIECRLETGRTHQIRVHLSHQGHPLVGDPLYHPKPKGPLMLHAHQLQLTHPLTGEVIQLTCPGERFEQLL